MRPLADMPDEIAAGIAVVFCDIDDTLTRDGVLPACAYGALEALAAAGIAVAPITGRPAGWCDMIARMWPVNGVVGENGAFYFAYDRSVRRMRRVFAVEDRQRAADRVRLAALGQRIISAVPGCAIASDQLYREADLAIDFREDVTPLPLEAAGRIKAMFEADGAVAKISSIHVNGWFGAYDKLSTARRFAADVLRFDIDRDRHLAVFVGDSPNDAPMFGFFPNACGVSNVLAFRDTIDALPAFVSRGPGGEGFVEVANAILRARQARPAAA